MLDINCLLKNTQIIDDIKDWMQYMAYDRAANKQDVSLPAIYNELRKQGIEIDLRSAGHIYSEHLPHEPGFNSREDVEKITSGNFENTLRNLMTMKPKGGHEEISRLSPEEHVSNGIANALYNDIVPDASTRSIMKELQDAVQKGAERLLGKLPSEKENKKEDFIDTIRKALQLEEKGYRGLDGKMNSIKDLFEATKEELKRYTAEINKSDNEVLKQQWNDYANDLENATYSLLFSKKETRNILTESLKEAGYRKTLANGKTIIDWDKLSKNIGDTSALEANVKQVMLDRGFGEENAQKVAESLRKEYQGMKAEITQKAYDKLTRMQDSKNKIKAPAKTDFDRLVQLNDLGIFNGTHNELLYRMLGVDALAQQDINELQEIAQKASALSIEVEGKNYLGSYAFQNFERRVNEIIGRNIGNKTNMLKVVSGIDKYFQLLNFGRIANVFNMIENNVSGSIELFGAHLNVMQQMGWKAAFQDGKLFRDTFKDVMRGGVNYGHGEHSKFVGHDFVDSKFKELTVEEFKKNKAKWLGTLIMRAGKAFLNGSDSAFKAVLHHKSMMLALHKALTQHGKSKAEANAILHEALYGKNLEQAHAKAAQILERYGMKATKEATGRLANDLVIANLNNGALIDDATIEAAYNSGYHTAAVGLGHEAQSLNKIAQKIDAGKREARIKEGRLAKEQQWGKLAGQKVFNTIYYNGITPFVSGSAKWVHLRIQSRFGLGIVTGAVGGRWHSDLDFTSPAKLEESMKDRLADRGKIARGLSGLAYTGVTYALATAIGNTLKKEEESGTDNVFEKIKADRTLNKLFLKVGPDIMVLDYLKKTEKHPLMAPIKYVQNTFNIGDSYGVGAQIIQVSEDIHRNQEAKAYGDLINIVGGRLDIPLWRSYKGGWQAVKWATGNGTDQNYHQPYTFMQGLLGGGCLEDLGLTKYLGADRMDTPLDALPGLSKDDREYFREQGIKTIGDLDRIPDWQNEIESEAGAEKADKARRKMLE